VIPPQQDRIDRARWLGTDHKHPVGFLSVHLRKPPLHSLLEVFPYWADHPGHVHFTDMAFEYQVKDGYLQVPQRPGLGIELLEEKVRPLLWAEIGPREVRAL
jgi:hypothetical protein